MKWTSKVNGKHLRTLIDEEESFKVLQELERLLNQIKNNPDSFKLDEYDLEQFEDLLGNVESDTYAGEDELLNYIKGENYISNIRELVDGRLTEFYDLCDSNRIWITI